MGESVVSDQGPVVSRGPCTTCGGYGYIEREETVAIFRPHPGGALSYQRDIVRRPCPLCNDNTGSTRAPARKLLVWHSGTCMACSTVERCE